MENCNVDRCDRKAVYKGHCPRHYEQLRRVGRILHVTKFDKRPAIISGHIALIPLGVGAKGGHAVVDAADSWLDKYNWCLDKLHGYAVSVINQRHISMHRFLTNAPRGFQVDHKDTNKLNNRRGNLRFTNSSGNAANTSLHANNTTGFKGVVRAKEAGYFTARLTHKGRNLYLGYFSSAEEAADAYDKKALELFGSYARTNKMITSS